jgi:hypothetical protein
VLFPAGKVKRISENNNARPSQRALFAFMGLLAGDVALLLFLLLNAVRLRAALLKAHMGAPTGAFLQARDMFIVYAIFSIVG